MISLVTGGAGFIGSHLADRIIEDESAYVITVDNIFTGEMRTLSHLRFRLNFELIRHDVVDPPFLEVDEIYHLACPATPIHYQYNPAKTIKTNVEGTLNILGLAKRVNARVLLTSTSEVYGDPKEHPQKEEYWGNVNPIGPRSCYDEGKRLAESLMMAYFYQNKVEIRMARLFNTYGLRMSFDEGRVVSTFILQALRNEPLTIFGTGNQTRSFCYDSDIIDGISRLTKNDHTVPVNLGNTEEKTILEIATLVKDVTNSSSELVFRPLPEDDPVRRQPDISLAREKLSWYPRVTLKEGLDKDHRLFRQTVKKHFSEQLGFLQDKIQKKELSILVTFPSEANDQRPSAASSKGLFSQDCTLS
jgi:UDP-glucuronate decarboxylase